MNDPIDAVITWVDGSDPKHVEKKNKYLKQAEKDTHPWGVLEGRFLEVDEVKYCIYSIRKYAPWIRNIFLVTDNQCPDWLDDKTKEKLNVIIIDHEVIFRDYLQYLPTFNSLSIGTAIWKIPNLSDRFIYFNDDVFLINRTNPEDFFIGDKTVIRGNWRLDNETLIKKLKRIVRYVLMSGKINNIPWDTYNYQTIGARLVGYKDNHFEMVHAPVTAKISVLKKFFEDNTDVFNWNIRHRFRNKNQTSSFVIFAHVILKEDQAIINDGCDSVMIIPRKGGLKRDRYKFDMINSEKSVVKFLCFQDLYYLKQENPEEFREVIEYFNKTIMSD